MPRALIFLSILLLSLLPVGAYAQQCEGPPEACAKILELQKDLDKERAAAKSEKDAAVKSSDEKESSRSARIMALAAAIAVGMKIFISLLKTWSEFFKTDQGKAAIKAILLVVGFAAFVLTNIGTGIKWWQALIVAGGAPGAILVHELVDLVPAVLGKKKLPPEPPPPQVDAG